MSEQRCFWCGPHREDPEQHYRYWHLPFGSPLLLDEPPVAAGGSLEGPDGRSTTEE